MIHNVLKIVLPKTIFAYMPRHRQLREQVLYQISRRP
jgi:hypothetical protein